MDIYIVQPGDSVDSIAAMYGVSPYTIIFDNQMIPPYALAIGQALLISDGTFEDIKAPIISNGYAYPYISNWVLD